MLKKLSFPRAFTLLELLIVLLIIGILIAIGLYRYQSVVESGQNLDAQTALRAGMIASQAVYTKDGNSFDSSGASLTDNMQEGGLTFTEWTTAPEYTDPLEPVKDILVSWEESGQQVSLCNHSESGVWFCLRTTSSEADLNQTLVANFKNFATSSGDSLEAAYCHLRNRSGLPGACDPLPSGGNSDNWMGTGSNAENSSITYSGLDSPSNGTVVLTGSGFAELDAFYLTNSANSIGYDIFNPDGQSLAEGSTQPDGVTVTWSDTEITISGPGVWNSLVFDEVQFRNYDGDLLLTETLSPTIKVLPVADITGATSPSDGEISITGTGMTNYAKLHIFSDQGDEWDIYDPNGPDSGNNPPGISFTSWSNGLIEFSMTALESHRVSLDVYNPSDNWINRTGTFEVGPTPIATGYSSPADNQIQIVGQNLNALDSIGIRINNTRTNAIEPRYYREDGPNAGLNPAGSTVVWTNASVTITDSSTIEGTTVWPGCVGCDNEQTISHVELYYVNHSSQTVGQAARGEMFADASFPAVKPE